MIYWNFFMVGPFVNAKSCWGLGSFMVSLPGCCSVLVPVWLLLCAYSPGHGICCTLVFSSLWSTWGAPGVHPFLSLRIYLSFTSLQAGMYLRCTSSAEEEDCVPGLQKGCPCSDLLLFMSLTLFLLWILFLLVAALLKAWDDLVFLYIILVSPFQLRKVCDSVSLFGL